MLRFSVPFGSGYIDLRPTSRVSRLEKRHFMLPSRSNGLGIAEIVPHFSPIISHASLTVVVHQSFTGLLMIILYNTTRNDFRKN